MNFAIKISHKKRHDCTLWAEISQWEHFSSKALLCFLLANHSNCQTNAYKNTAFSNEYSINESKYSAVWTFLKETDLIVSNCTNDNV